MATFKSQPWHFLSPHSCKVVANAWPWVQVLHDVNISKVDNSQISLHLLPSLREVCRMWAVTSVQITLEGRVNFSLQQRNGK